MGVNANFVADFSTFMSAVAAADVKLADFGKGAEKVEQQLNDMVDKWSGRKLIQQANELTVAIEHAGGATALTTTEQIKLNAILTEAIAKYHAIGETVPADILKLANQTKQAADSTKDWSSTVLDLASAFGIAFSVDAAVNFVTQLFKDAQALQTLSQQTRISVEDLQVLTAATSAFGISGDELGRALFNLQAKIAGGDSSVASAYAKMGISVDNLRGKDAKSLFLETERGIAAMDVRLQDAAARDLYGGKLGASMLAFSTGVDDAMKKAADMNRATGDSVKAMAEYADAVDLATKSMKNWVTEGIGGSIGGIEALHKAMGQGGLLTDLKIVGAGWLDWAQTQITGAQHAEHLAKVFDDLNRKTEENAAKTDIELKAHRDVVVALDDHAKAVNYMAILEGQATVPLLDWQVQYLAHLKEMNQLDAEHAAGIFVTAQQLDKYKAGLEASKKAADELKKSIADADAIALDSYNKRIKSLEAATTASLKYYNFAGQIAQLDALKKAEEDLARSVYAHIDSEKARAKILEDLAAKQAAIELQKTAVQEKQKERTNKAVIDELEAQERLEAAYGRNVDGTVKMDTAAGRLDERLKALHATKVEGISQAAQERELMDLYLKELKEETDATDLGTDAKKRKTQATKDESAAVKDLHGSLTLLITDLRDPAFYGPLGSGQSSVARTLAAGGTYTPQEAAYIAAGGIISGSIGGGITHRAGGGPVDSGTPYLVGERGPELFVPSSNGNIAPNGAGGLSVSININGSVLGTPNEIARVVGDAMMNLLRSQGTRLPVGAYST